MKQMIESEEQYKLPEVAFKFVYKEAQNPDYAEELVESLNNKR